MHPGKKPHVQKSASLYSYLPASGPVWATVCGYSASGACNDQDMQCLGESAYAAYLLLQPFLRNLNKFCQYILGKDFAKIYALGPWLRQHFVPNTDWTYSHEV